MSEHNDAAELKSCPFCGYKASMTNVESSAGSGGRYMWVVGCDNEECDVSFHGHATRRQAAVAWNARTGEGDSGDSIPTSQQPDRDFQWVRDLLCCRPDALAEFNELKNVTRVWYDKAYGVTPSLFVAHGNDRTVERIRLENQQPAPPQPDAAKEQMKQEAIDAAFKLFGSSAGAYSFLFNCGWDANIAAQQPASPWHEITKDGLPEKGGRYLWQEPRGEISTFNYADGEGFFHQDRFVAWRELPQPFEKGE